MWRRPSSRPRDLRDREPGSQWVSGASGPQRARPGHVNAVFLVVGQPVHRVEKQRGDAGPVEADGILDCVLNHGQQKAQRNALTLFAHDGQFGQHAGDARVAADVYALAPDRRRTPAERSPTGDLVRRPVYLEAKRSWSSTAASEGMGIGGIWRASINIAPFSGVRNQLIPPQNTQKCSFFGTLCGYRNKTWGRRRHGTAQNDRICCSLLRCHLTGDHTRRPRLLPSEAETGATIHNLS